MIEGLRWRMKKTTPLFEMNDWDNVRGLDSSEIASEAQSRAERSKKKNLG